MQCARQIQRLRLQLLRHAQCVSALQAWMTSTQRQVHDDAARPKRMHCEKRRVNNHRFCQILHNLSFEGALILNVRDVHPQNELKINLPRTGAAHNFPCKYVSNKVAIIVLVLLMQGTEP